MGIQNVDAYMRLFRGNRLPIRFGFTHYTGFTMNRDAEGFYGGWEIFFNWAMNICGFRLLVWE